MAKSTRVSIKKKSEGGLPTATARIYAKIFALLEKNPEGVRWSEILKKLNSSKEKFHPKTVNGCVWKLVEKYPDKVYKPSKGLFRLVKYRSKKNKTSTM